MSKITVTILRITISVRIYISRMIKSSRSISFENNAVAHIHVESFDVDDIRISWLCQ